MTASGDYVPGRIVPRSRPTRAEAAVLLGMTMSIVSLFLPWDRITVPQQIALFPTLYNGPSVLSGFQNAVHWPLSVCGILCGLTLVWSPIAKARLPLLFTQTLCGLVCLLIPLRQFVQSGYQPLSGVLVALVGGALLLFGALDRATRNREGVV